VFVTRFSDLFFVEPLAYLPLAVAKRSDIKLRRAERSDGPRLCELFRDTAMKADLHLTVERDPDFFALYDLQDVDTYPFVAEVDGRIEGLGTYLARDGYLDGQRVRVGYAGDLRLSPKVAGGFLLGRNAAGLFEEASSALGCEMMLTSIIASNTAAERALVKRSRRFVEKPFYQKLDEFDILSVQFTFRRKPRLTPLKVRTATDTDVDRIAALLAADHEQRPFGYVFSAEELRRRLQRWPGLKIEHFYLAETAEGELRGVAAVWDPDAVKRYRVLGYHGSMKWIRRFFNVGARFGGFPPLPPPGEVLRYFYLTHVSIVDEEADTMAALVDRIYADFHGRSFHFFTTYLTSNDSLAPAYTRFRTTPLATHLYLVSKPGSPYNTFTLDGRRPGVEVALL